VELGWFRDKGVELGWFRDGYDICEGISAFYFTFHINVKKCIF